MDPLEALAIVVAGIGAGAINTVVGSGTLITFPVLIALGYAPLLANVSNNVGLVPGSVSGAIGYRRELRGQRSRAVRLGACSIIGGLAGAVLLLALPASAFDAIVPALIGLAVALVVLQPRLTRALAARRRHADEERRPSLLAAVAATGVYGGYFGAAQGVLLMAVLGIGVADSLQRHTATKNVLALLVNAVAAVVFIAVADVDWTVAGLIALGSIVGGQVGATVGRRLSPTLLRAVIATVGIAALVAFLV